MEYRSNTLKEISMDIDCSDLYERDRRRLYEAVKAYGPYLLCSTIINILCIDTETSILSVCTGPGLLSMFGYFFHRLLHILPESPLNTHIYIHHSPHRVVSRELNLLLEILPPLVNTLLFSILQYILNFHIVSYKLLILWTLYYISVHLINYSIIGSVFHEKHHKYKDVNFTADYWDHIFGTNATEECEDLSHTIPNLLVSFILTYTLFNV